MRGAAGADGRCADLRAPRRHSPPQIQVRPAVYPAAVVLARHAADHALVLDYLPRHVGNPRQKILNASRMPAMHDVVIVGGGPAGLHAAARLAASGFRTTLVDEHPVVSEPVHCTGVLSAEAVSEFTLPRRALLNELTTARFWSPLGHQVSYSAGKVEAVVIDRRLFDQDLLEIAETAGAVVLQGSRVTALQI